MYVLSKRKMRKFKRKIMLKNKFIKTNDKKVLFISSQGESFDQLSRNISHFFYEKHFINTKTDSVSNQVKLILKAKYIFVDGFYLPLGLINSKDKIIVNVSNKNFSMKKTLMNTSVLNNEKEKLILQKAIDNVSYLTVGSKKMKDLVMKSYNLEDDKKILELGCPHMDEFFGYSFEENAQKVMQMYPDSLVNLNILYVPTYRDNDIDNHKQIDFIEKLVSKCDENISVYYHLHPKFKNKPKGEVLGAHEIESDEVSSFFTIANVIVTDYSSIIFEASMCKKPIVFYQYDLDSYKEKLSDIDFPGFKTTSDDEMIDYLINAKFKLENSNGFYNKFNEFNHGKSSRDLVLKVLGKFKRQKNV
ncbi:MAG: CDP-glycerol glycerophosphotransferase family protein [Mycoplasmatales bacterium]